MPAPMKPPFNSPAASSGRVYAGGTPKFNEATGQYRQKPPTAQPNMPKPPMTKPQARMQALQKRFQ